MVSVWPTSPRITSWWATSPGRRTEWIGTLVPSRAASPSARRSAPRCRSARRACVVVQLDDLGPRHVPRGLGGELHHQHGADREVGGHEHVGAGAAQLASSSRSKPVVPITTCTPAATASRALATAVVGIVKSTSTPGPRRAPRPPSTPSAGSARATSSMSGGASTARQTVSPIRPAAPATATLIDARRGLRPAPAPTRPAAPRRSGRASGPIPAADSRSGPTARRPARRDPRA